MQKKKKGDNKGDQWLNPTQALGEQGVPEEAILQLKKKFYVDDANVDRSDPVQLHLVYVQSHEGIVSGMHNISKEEALQFASLQCQMVYGNYAADKHTTSWFKNENRLADLLPKNYRKTKKIVDDIVKEWKKLVNTNDVNAKYRYVQLCRSLKTYGITYFTCKWKPRGKRKLEPIMLGITRDNIICVDPDGRDVKEEQPLTHLRRWAAGPSSFTLDFGDYRDEYMSLATEEGEAISQLLAGYIDILLKRRKDGGVVIEEDEGEVATEEHVGTIQGHASHSVTTTEFDGGLGATGSSAVMSGMGQIAGISPGLAGMLGQVGSLSGADSALLNLMNDLLVPIPIGSHGSKSPDELRQELARFNNALAQAAGALIRDASNGMGRGELDKHSPDLALNLAQLIGAAKQAAAAAGGDVSLLDGAKAVSDALRRLMGAAGDLADNPSAANRSALAEAAALLQATSAALNATACGNLADDESRNLLLESAKAVAAATKELLDTSRLSVANADPNTKQQQAAGAQRVEVGNAKVALTANAMAPVIADIACQRYVADSAKALTDACGFLLSSTQAGVTDPKSRNDLARAVKQVNDAIAQLVNTTQCVGSKKDAKKEAMAAAAFEIQDAVAKVMSSAGNADLIVSASKAVREASANLIQAAKGVAADTTNPNEKQRLFQGIAGITNAVKNMLTTATVAAQNPDNDDAHKSLRDDALKVSDATKAILGDISTKDAALAALRTAAKATAAATSGLVADAKGAASSASVDPATRQSIYAASIAAASATASLVESVRDSWQNPKDGAKQSSLVEAAVSASKPSAGLVASVRAAIPKVDAAQKKSLNGAAAAVSEALSKLSDALRAVKEADGHMEVDEALEDFVASQADLDYALISARDGHFEALPGQSRDGAMELLQLTARALRSAADELTESARVSPQAMGPPAKQTTAAVGQVFGAAKAVASTTDSKPARTKILTAAKGVGGETERLVMAGRALSVRPNDPELSNNMGAALGALGDAIDVLLAAAANSGAGGEECDTAGEAIVRNALETLNGFGSGSGDLQEFAEELAACCKALDAAVSQVVDSARNNPKALGPAANLTASTMPPIMRATNNASARSPDAVVGQHILGTGKKLAEDTSGLLRAAKSVSASPDDQGASQHLSNASKVVRDDIKELLKAVDAAIPGKKDLVEALELITSATSRLNQPSMPTENPQVHLKEISDAAKSLADSVGRIVASARNFPEKLGPYSKQAAEAVSDIVDASKDASSRDSAAVIQLSAQKLSSSAKKSSSDPQDTTAVVEGAKDVARDASTLVSNVKKAAAEEKDAGARRQLISAAESCASVTQQLAEAAKGVARRQPGADKRLMDANTNLDKFIRAVAAYNRTDGKPDFRPLLDAARLVADEASKMIEVLKDVAARPKDASAQTQLSVAAKSTIDGIKQLIQAAEDLTYGHKECKEAIEVIQHAIGDLDATAINATVGLLEQSIGGPTNQQCKEELIALSRDLAAVTGKLVTAAKNEPEELGSAAQGVSVVVPKVVDSSKRLAATTTDSETQQAQLQLAKNMTDSMLELVQASRETSTNPLNQEVLNRLAASAKAVSAAITELVSRLKGGVMGLRACDEAIAAIEAAQADLGKASRGGKSYAQSGDEINRQTRELVSVISRLATAAKNDPDRVGDASKAVADALPRLVEAINAAAAASTEEKVKQKLMQSGRAVVSASRDAVAGGKDVAADPKNVVAIAALSQQQRNVTQAIGELLNTVRAGATLEREADQAVARIQATMADLDSASLFAAATAGKLEVDLPRGATLDTCQTQLSGDTKQLLSLFDNTSRSSQGGAASQEALANALKNLAGGVEQTGRGGKNVASLLGDLVAQQDVLTAAKAVAIASQSLVLASKECATRPEDADAQRKLRDNHASATAAAKELLSVSEAASAGAVKGIRELEKAERDIEAQLRNFDSPQWAGNRNGNAEHVVKNARVLASASGNVVSTCTSDAEGLCKAAKQCGEAVTGLLADAKGAGETTDDPKVKETLHKAVRDASRATAALLAAAKTAKDTPESQKELSGLSEKVADRIMEVVGAARRLPGGAGLRLEEDSGDDLEAIAEQELLKAARMIEDAAKRLLAARPKRVKTSDQLDEQDIQAAILDAARAITVATGGLVQAATSAQRERIAKRRDPAKRHFYRKDPAWANGLISAAQAVGGTTQDLVNASNGFVKKEEGNDEEFLIASAKQVAAATARLMAASRAKSDPFSDSHKSLAEASKAVAAATQALVEAAKMAGQALNEPELVESALEDISVVQARKQQLKAQADMLRLEKELLRARTAYSALNQAKYTPGSSSSSAADGDASDAGPSSSGRPALPPPRAGTSPSSGGRGGAPPPGGRAGPRPTPPARGGAAGWRGRGH